MEIDSDGMGELDRAQLLKFGTAALFALTAAGLPKSEANATGTLHPFTLVYEVQGFSIKRKSASKNLGVTLERLLLTSDARPIVGNPTIRFEMDNVVPKGIDETEPSANPTGNPHDVPPGTAIPKIFVALWLDMGR